MSEFDREAFALLAAGVFIIGTRTYWRISTVGLSRLQADDYLMLFASVVYAAETVLAYTVGALWMGLANNAMTDEHRVRIDPNSKEYIMRVNGSKTQVAGWCTYTFLLWILKACMCVFYLRLTDGIIRLQKLVYVGFGLLISTWFALLMCILFGCGLPFEKNWQIYPDPGNSCQPAVSNIDIFVTVVFNAATDMYLLTIPAIMLWRVSISLPLHKRLGWMLLFSGGVFMTAAGILRCALIVTDPVNGAQQAGSWAGRETFVAVFTTNLPMVGPAVNKWTRGLVSVIRTSVTGRSSRMGGLSVETPGLFQTNDNSEPGVGRWCSYGQGAADSYREQVIPRLGVDPGRITGRSHFEESITELREDRRRDDSLMLERSRVAGEISAISIPATNV